tara:strand:- start:240 stop:443 length:204 start_codon:yes stop_codon:yes gene_type:complete
MKLTKQILLFLSVLFIEFVLVVLMISLITPQTFMDALYDPTIKVGMLFLGLIFPIIVAAEYGEQNYL